MTARSLSRPLVAGNWKMHKTVAEASAFIEALLPSLSGEESIDVVLCPAYLALRPMVDWTRDSRVAILCVGESEEQCQLGETEHVVCQQLRSGLELVDATRLGDVVIAYEPIWTIGTGRMAALEHTQEVGALVRRVVAERSSEQATRTRVLYGGRACADTAATLLAGEDVDGLLVGEPSLDADLFLSILNAVRS